MFYDNFKQCCENEGLTIEEVCNDLNIPYQTYWQWSKKGSTPKKETVDKIIDFLGIKDPENTLLLDCKAPIDTTRSTRSPKSVSTSGSSLKEIRTYSDKSIQIKSKKDKEDKMIEVFLDDIRSMLQSYTNRQRCEFMMLVYDWKEESK